MQQLFIGDKSKSIFCVSYFRVSRLWMTVRRVPRFQLLPPLPSVKLPFIIRPCNVVDFSDNHLNIKFQLELLAQINFLSLNTLEALHPRMDRLHIVRSDGEIIENRKESTNTWQHNLQ